MRFIERIHQFNNFDASGFVPFIHQNECIGLLREPFFERIKNFSELFAVAGSGISLLPGLQSYDKISEALGLFGQELVSLGIIEYLLQEPYPVKNAVSEVLFEIDRAMVPYFGFRSYGQHLNGFVRQKNDLFLWIARRARDRRIFPGLLDNMVAGGLPHGLSLEENLIKECHEEAGMPAELARQAKLVSALTYNAVSEKGYKPDTLYCYDIELSKEFKPVNTDGEVERFELMPVNEVKSLISQGGLFKPNCELVLIDFFCRHGLMDGESPEFLQIQQALHVPFYFDECGNQQ